VESGKQSQERSRLLIVEDDEAQLRTLTAIMRAEGFEVTGCSTASEALQHLDHGGFAVAVVDLQLSDLPEEQLLPRLRAVADDVRVVINTGYGSYESARDAVNLGAFAYVEKAGDPGEIVRHVHRAFHSRLRCYAANLESAVAEQTRELQEANEALRLEIADRKQAEERLADYQRRLRSLGAKLALAEEQERRRIAADLHDDVGQALSLAMMKLRAFRQKSPSAAGAPLEEIEQLLGHAVLRTRSLLFDLSPPPLYELGLEAAIEWLAEKFQTEHKLPVAFEPDGKAAPVSEEVRGILFRAVREALHNTVKYANAQHAWITSRREDPHLRIEVADDGKGFDPEKPLRDASGGFGLFHIRERLDHAGGRLEIHSEPGRGTRIVLLAPLAKDALKGQGGVS
jgi:signal transduction histidine kinase